MAKQRVPRQEPAAAPVSPWPAVLLTCILGPGAGHAFVGLAPRAIALWLASVAVGVGYVAALALAPGSLPAAGLLLVPVAAYGVAIIDLLVVSRARLKPPAALALVAFWLCSIALAVAIALGIRVALLEAFKVPSGAMMPTLVIGDHFFVGKIGAVQRGDVAVYRFPGNRAQDFVHRVVGVGGDRIEMREGSLVINGEAVPLCSVGRWTPAETNQELELFVERLGAIPHLIARSPQRTEMHDESRSWTVPQGEVFVMGDNRDNSHDSRMWQQGRGGTVPLADVKGRALSLFLRRQGPAHALVGPPVLPPGADHLQPALDACLSQPAN